MRGEDVPIDHGCKIRFLRLCRSTVDCAEHQQKICIRLVWRKGWDSNPRCPCRHAGFQDRCLKPLGHPSVAGPHILAGPRRQCEAVVAKQAMKDGWPQCQAKQSRRAIGEVRIPARSGTVELHQARAKARRLEHSSTRLAVVSAKNPPETASWLRMRHLPLAMLVRIN